MVQEDLKQSSKWGKGGQNAHDERGRKFRAVFNCMTEEGNVWN